MECCDGADVDYLETAEFFGDTTCVGPVPLAIYNIYFAGGCSDEGKFFYGELCGGSDFGPFSFLSDGTELGLGNCAQPSTTCDCLGYINTAQGGCYNAATP